MRPTPHSLTPFCGPSMGRFTTRDPIEEKGGNNLYAFVGNNGTSKYDYLGLVLIPVIRHTPYDEPYTDWIWVEDGTVELEPFKVNGDHSAIDRYNMDNLGRDFSDAINQGIQAGLQASLNQGINLGVNDSSRQDSQNKKDPKKPENPDCAGLRQSLDQATQIRDKNADYFAPGGQYAGYTRDLSNVDVASLGALSSGAGLGAYSEVILKPNVPYGGVPGPAGTTSFHMDARLSGFRTLGAVATVAGAGLDGYSLGRSAIEGDLAGASLSFGNLGVDFTAAIWGGVPGVALAGGQLLVNGGIFAYQQYHEAQYVAGRDANATAAFNVANNAQDKIDQVSKQIQALGCK